MPAQKAPTKSSVSLEVHGHGKDQGEKEGNAGTVAHVGAYLVQAVVTHEDHKIIRILTSFEICLKNVDGRRGRGEAEERSKQVEVFHDEE
jgi:hypothetical protein